MIRLYYVGFNGYQQVPLEEENGPNIVDDWICIPSNEILNISCSHKTVCIETKSFFKIFGALDFNIKSSPKLVEKPTIIDNFKVFDEYLIGNSGMSLWIFKYNITKWEVLKLKFVNKEEEQQWNKTENKILKYSLREDSESIIILLNNGSIWVLTGKNKITIFFQCSTERVVDITSGLEHILILTESGCVLSCGNGRGQLGHGDLNSINQPVQISALEGLKVKKIEAGGWHSCAITDSGDLYAWGWNNYGQISAFDDNSEVGLVVVPTLVEVIEDSEIGVIDVGCGFRHTVTMLENGKLYSTGWNYYRQLGLGLKVEKVSRFSESKIKISKNGKIYCGPWFTIIFDNVAV